MRGFSRNSIAGVLLVAWLSLGSSCGAAEDSIAPQEGATEALDVDRESTSPLIELFPAALTEDLQNLQQAIDLRLEEDVAACMVASGWEYVLADPQEPVPAASLISQSIERLNGRASASPNTPLHPNQRILDSLSESDQIGWSETFDGCLVGSTWNVSHPLAAEENLLTELQEQASDLVKADERYLSAQADAVACFKRSGFDSPENAFSSLNDLTFQILSQLDSNEIDTSEALAKLIALEDTEHQMRSSWTDCNDPLLNTNRRLFAEHLNTLAADHPELPFLVAEVEDFMEPYVDLLSELRSDG